MALPGGKSDFESLTTTDTYYDTTEESGAYSLTPDSDLSRMDPATRAKAEEEWKNDLAKTEEEIATLRHVLSAKIKHMQELKRKLGITVWKEFVEDMGQGIKNIQESTAYQKTSQTLKTASEKTSEALGNIGASVSKKLEEVKNSPAYKTIEEKVGSAYSNVKTKVSGSPQNDGGNFEEALISAGAKTDGSSESIPAEKST